MNPPHILLTSLGVRPQMVCYRLGDCEQRAEFASIALLRLLPIESRPREVIALVTNAASEKSWEPFVRAANEAGVNVKRIDVPEGRNAEEIREILEGIAREFPDGSYCTLDLTGGLRHFPFLFYALALYLGSLRGIMISGAYYGMLEGRGEGESAPLIDLRPLLDLPEWFFAVRQFRRAGDASVAADSFKSIADEIKRRAAAAGHDQAMHNRARGVGKLAEGLRELAFATASALPLEIGAHGCAIERRATSDAAQALAMEMPLGATLVDLLRSSAADLALTPALCGSRNWKQGLTLTADELRRQARLVDRYIERQQLPPAAGLMREWVVSLILFHAGENRWLARKSRTNAERQLGALSAASVKDSGIVLSEEQRPWASFWNALGAIRNSLHHHGMREEAVSSTPGGWSDVLAFWQQIKTAEIAPPTFGGGSGRLLVSPLGQRPGVLFSALRKSEPERCLVLCSTATRGGVDAAVKAARFTGPIELLEIADPHAGFCEIAALTRAAKLQLLAADEVVVNLTGGTTLMGIAAQQFAESARELMRPVRRMVLIDRRPPQEQDCEPFFESDCHWLDGLPEEETN